jgi:hypothetical protein
VVGATKIRDVGVESLKWNLVIVSEGFDATEQGDFATRAADFVTALLGYQPFDDLSAEINAFRLDVISDESGADNPLTCPDGTAPVGGAATTARTYFDAAYCEPPPEGQSIRRLLTVDTGLVETTVNDHVPDWDAIIVIVNHDEYGGSGAPGVAVTSTGTPWTVPIHELGHSAFDLGDEYCDLAGTHTEPEPPEKNLTKNTDRATLKWAALVDPATPIPTTQNANCALCDNQPSPVAAGTVGLFEGGDRMACDIYRPEFDCMMRTNGVAFCAVCIDAIASRIRYDVVFGDCFVATAVYGDRAHPDVEALRRWRDRHLRVGARARRPMRVLVALYRIVGPRLARSITPESRLAGALRRRVIAPLATYVRPTPSDVA